VKTQIGNAEVKDATREIQELAGLARWTLLHALEDEVDNRKYKL
jgi:hypothetical protein